MIRSAIRSVEYALPATLLTNDDLALLFPEWTADKVEKKLGIVSRGISARGEFASDLAVRAAEKVFASGVCTPSDIDYILFCTQSPDYILPTTACLIQERLAVPTASGALDFNLGCSGWVYGLGLAKGLIESGQAKTVLLLTGETYSKLLAASDKATRTLFGDAGAATLITSVDADEDRIGPFTYGTDGSGAGHLMVHGGGARGSEREGQEASPTLCMNGGEVFSFSAQVVPRVVGELLEKAGMEMDAIDLFIFHQANAYMLEFLQKKCCIAREKFYTWYSEAGNTVSNTIPIALHHAIAEGRVQAGSTVMFVGFGVGLSWSACLAKF